jgi:hypothetical protein
MAIFTNQTYYILKQRKFEEALNEKNYQKARGILESFPKGHNASEKAEYLIAINEGYKALFDLFGEDLNSSNNQKELGELLSEFGIENNLEDLEAKLSKLAEYGRILKDPQEVKCKLEELERYKELGKYEDLDSQLSELDDLRRVNNVLNSF